MATICTHALLVWFSDIAIENALWGLKTGKTRKRNSWICTPNELDLTFRVPYYGAKFH